ncbi:MAG: Cu(2+)-exporting ATPase [Calditrichaeota bacterium]|nr:MAG: Cu(2+)-exporting ATPase [Calditrichota bacterium]
MSNKIEKTFEIDGMHCAACVANVEKGLQAVNGITDSRVNLMTNSAVVAYDNTKVTTDSIISQITKLGYKAKLGRPDILKQNERELVRSKKNFIGAFLFTVPLMLIAMYPMFTDIELLAIKESAVVQAILGGFILFYCGRSILIDAFKQLTNLRSNMNTLISMGTLTAYFWSLYATYLIFNGGEEFLYFESAAMIITLILLGRFFEAKSKGKAGEAIKALMSLTPPKALAEINGVELEIESATIQKGMMLIVRPGERIPIDGRILENRPDIDESMLTGESLPVSKIEGDEVFGGSLNGNIPFKMEVTTERDQTLLSSIIRLVTDAQSQKAPIQKLADKISSVFVPIVLLIALTTLAVWYFVAPESEMMVRSVIAVLIIACPCSLGLATPTAILAGSGRLAKEGIIIRHGDIFEKVTKLNSVIFDKTGTLTMGQLEVVEVKSFAEMNEQDIIGLTASAEIQSEHPIAKAIIAYQKKYQLEKRKIKDVTIFPGFGLKAEYNNRRLVIGNSTFLKKEKINLGNAETFGESEMQKGRTVIFVALDERITGMIALADKVRPEAKDVISYLKSEIETITLLSGDTRTTAGGVARTLGIENFEAEIRPEQKQTIVQSLKRAGFKIAMIGDGINDAPALAEADIGIAIGSGTDIAIESSDVILVRSELSDIIKLFKFSKFTMQIIKQNLFWAFAYNILAIPVAAGIFYPLFGWSLSPMIAAGAMSFSSLFVVLNSLRLNSIEL